MPDQPREIIVPDVVRYGIWPGGDWMCLEAVSAKVGGGMWLLSPDGREQELRPYRLGMFRRRR